MKILTTPEEKRRAQALAYVHRQLEKNPELYRAKANATAKRYRERNLEAMRIKEKEKSRLRRLRNKKHYNLLQQEYRKNNPDKFKAYYEKRKQIQGFMRQTTLRKYGLSQEDFDAMVIKQEGKCAICNFQFKGTPHIDHNHKTGTNRKLLCQDCNLLLGWVEKGIEKDKNILSKVAEYLTTHT
jgi:hypothetical protein